MIDELLRIARAFVIPVVAVIFLQVLGNVLTGRRGR